MSRQPRSRTTPSRIGGRILIMAVAVITTIMMLGLMLNDLVRVIYLFDGAYSLDVALGSPLGVEANLSGDSEQTNSYYWSVLISSHEALQFPKVLQALAVGLTTLTFVAAAVVILLLCRRLWTGRTFAPSAASGLLVLASLTLITAWLAPWLRHEADRIALDQLGYATSGGDRWVELRYYDIGMVDGSLLVLGVVLLLAGLVYLGARRLQRDTEGLI